MLGFYDKYIKTQKYIKIKTLKIHIKFVYF